MKNLPSYQVVRNYSYKEYYFSVVDLKRSKAFSGKILKDDNKEKED